MSANERRRQLGLTEIHITPVAMGCWPITGISSIDVNEADSLATLAAGFLILKGNFAVQ